MKINRILYPTDFSESSKEALAVATSLARDNSATLIIGHVFEPPEPMQGMVSHSSIPVTTSAEQTQKLEDIQPPDPAVKYEHRMVDGSPSDGIVKLAEEEKVDLIVMSTHGNTGVKRLLLGSVAEHVVRYAACPVLTLKAPEPAATQS